MTYPKTSILRLILTVLLFLLITQAIAQNYDAELISHETNISVRNGKLTKELSYEIKIYNRAGERFSKVAIDNSKMSKVSKIEAHIKDNNYKTVKKLKKSDITRRSKFSNISFFEDNFVTEFTLKHNIYPYYIYYSYQIEQEEFIYIDVWVPILDSKTPTLNATLIVETPNNYVISYANELVDDPSIGYTDETAIYQWSTSYTNIIEPERFSAPLINFLPTVIVVPQKFKYELEGSFNSWETYGDWQYNVIQGLSNLPQDEKSIISNMISGINDNREKIKILYHYLQDETRYINISIETGGLKPYPATYVAENKYGDCKALTNYFKSVLEYIDIQSYYTKIHAGKKIHQINMELPSQQSNHVILCIPVENDTIWLDCTSDGAFNQLGTFTQNRDAFIIDKNQSHYTTTPALTNSDILDSRKVSIYRDLQGNVIADFHNTYRGDSYETLFFISQSLNKSEKLRYLRDKIVLPGSELIEYNIIQSHRDSSKISLSYSTLSNNMFNNYGDEVLIKLVSFDIPELEAPKNRKLPVQFDYPIYNIDTIEYIIPNDYSISNIPKDKKIVTEFGEYHTEFMHDKNIVTVIKSFLLHSGSYSIDRYSSLFDFINKAQEIERTTYIVIKK